MLGSFALTWDEFQPKMAARFESLLQTSEFSDVTLVAKDNSRVKAHKVILESGSTFTFLVFTCFFSSSFSLVSHFCKVILGSGSTFFNQILTHMKDNPHPLIYLMGVELEVLEAIMSFLYLGQVEINQEMIQAFMETATALQIDGLHTKALEEVKEKEETHLPFIINETETQFDVRCAGGVDAAASEMFNIKKKPSREMPLEKEPNDFNSLETKVNPPDNLQFPCDSCDFISERKRDLRYHMGEKHRHEQVNVKIETYSKKGKDGLYLCTMCPKKFTDPSNLRRHMAKEHYKILHFCTDCNYSAKRKEDIKHHHNNVHLGMKFPCTQCDHEASSPYILRIHERSKHK